jgi:hypothetical protein
MNRIPHENQNNDSRTRSSPQGCGEAVTSKFRGESGGTDCGCRTLVGFALGQGAAIGRIESVKSEAQSRSQATADKRGAAALDTNPSLRTAPLRLSDRHVDVSASCRGDRAQLWRVVSSRPRLASIVEMGMELPEAGTARARTAGTDHRAVAQGRVAAHKKGARGGKLASFFSMKQASCYNPFVGARGLRGVKRQSSMPGTGMIGFRPSPRLASLRVAADWDCTTGFNVAMFMRTTWCHFCAYCIASWADALYSSGIVRDPIAKQPRSCWLGSAGSAWNGSRPTPPNLILAKNAGIIRSTLTWQTSSLMTSTNSNRA